MLTLGDRGCHPYTYTGSVRSGPGSRGCQAGDGSCHLSEPECKGKFMASSHFEGHEGSTE